MSNFGGLNTKCFVYHQFLVLLFVYAVGHRLEDSAVIVKSPF